MNQLVERFAKLPRSQRALVAVLAYLLIGVGGYFALLQPVLSDIDAAESQRDALASERATIKARADSLPQANAEVEKLKADLVQALTELPADREIPGLLSEIDGLARRSGLEVRRFQPLPETLQEYYAEVPVQIAMSGGFHEVAIFFDRIRKMNRIVSVQDIALSEPVVTGTETNLTISGKARTYRFLTEEEIATARKQKRGKRSDGGGTE